MPWLMWPMKGSVNPISAPSPVVVRLMVPPREIPLDVGGIHERKPVVVAVTWQHVDHRVRLDKPLRRPLILADDGASEAGGGEAAVSGAVLSKARLFRMAPQSASLM